MASIPGLERPPGGGNGNPFQYPSLENAMPEELGGLQSVGPQSHTWLSYWASTHTCSQGQGWETTTKRDPGENKTIRKISFCIVLISELCKHIAYSTDLQLSTQVFVAIQPLSGVQLFATSWTAARQASLSSTISTTSWSLLKYISN